jgi:phage tail-like protein
MSESTKPPVPTVVAFPGFRFVVDVGNNEKAVFTECTLPVIEWETEELKEGGINTSTRLLPGRRRSAKLTFKNGIGNPEMLQWYLKALSGEFSRRSITIRLLDLKKEKAIAVWNVEEAFPVQWTGPELRAGDNTIAIQTLQLACGEIKVEIPGK